MNMCEETAVISRLYTECHFNVTVSAEDITGTPGGYCFQRHEAAVLKNKIRGTHCVVVSPVFAKYLIEAPTPFATFRVYVCVCVHKEHVYQFFVFEILFCVFLLYIILLLLKDTHYYGSHISEDFFFIISGSVKFRFL